MMLDVGLTIILMRNILMIWDVCTEKFGIYRKRIAFIKDKEKYDFSRLKFILTIHYGINMLFFLVLLLCQFITQVDLIAPSLIICYIIVICIDFIVESKKFITLCIKRMSD